MARIELTIDKNYLPEWGTWEGIRELVSNAKDAAGAHEGEFSIHHIAASATLVIENTGCTLGREALLLGNSTSRDRRDAIGQFGEGLKLGTLALARRGAPVKIRTGSEVWTAGIERSDKFQADVLAFQIETGRVHENRVRVEVGCVNAEAWGLLRDKFLFLGRETANDRVDVEAGSLLLAPRFKGRIYVKGVHVQTDQNLPYGYDFPDVEIDRDRKMLDRYDVSTASRRIWDQAMAAKPELVAKFLDLLESGKDCLDVGEYSARYFSDAVKAEAAARFAVRHGANAVPVANLAESKDLEHLGAKGVVAPDGLRALLEREIGSAATVTAKLKDEVTKTHSWSDLADAGRRNLERALQVANKGLAPEHQLDLGRVDVVDFRSPSLQGQFKDGRCLVAHKILGDFRLLLLVLVHEACHAEGGDGDKGHVEAIEESWSRIAVGLLGAS